MTYEVIEPMVPPTSVVAWYANTRQGVDMSQRTLLDVGCGEGRNTLTMAMLGYERVVGIDTDMQSLEVAASKAEKLGITSCEFFQLDALAAPELGQFDMVLGNQIFHDYEKLKRYEVLRALRESTKRSGINLVSGYVVTPGLTNERSRNLMLKPGELQRLYQSEGWEVTRYYDDPEAIQEINGREYNNTLANVMAIKR